MESCMAIFIVVGETKIELASSSSLQSID